MAPPVRYETFWGCLWRPVPPDGYVALGMCSALGLYAVPPNPPEGLSPPLDAVVCVREDLVTPAIADRPFSFAEFTLWPISPAPPDSGEINFSPGTVLISASSRIDVQAYSLRVAAPETVPALPKPPKITAPGDWPLAGAESVQASTDLPFFAVGDPVYGAFLDQMLANPTYTFVREDRYTLIPECGIYNQTGIQQSPQIDAHAGYSQQETTEFSETTGIEFDLNFGNSDSPISFTAKLTQSFTWARSFGNTISFDYTVQVPLVVPPDTTVAAYWITSTFKLVRKDQTVVATPVTANIPVGICYCEYPPSEKKQLRPDSDGSLRGALIKTARIRLCSPSAYRVRWDRSVTTC